MHVGTLNSDGTLSSWDELSGSVPPEWVNTDTVRWIHLEGCGDEKLAPLAEIGLHAHILELMAEDVLGPIVTSVDRTVFVQFPANLVDGSGQLQYASFTSHSSLVITVSAGPCTNIDRVRRDLASSRPLSSSNASEIMLRILESAVDSGATDVIGQRQRTLAISDAVLGQERRVDGSEEILRARRTIARVTRFIEEIGYCAGQLAIADLPLDTVAANRARFRDLLTAVENLHRIAGRVEDGLGDLHSHFLSGQQERTNRRLNVLTVVSAIYLPATLIAGVFGMNFEDIPLTQVPHGYFFALAVMLIIIAGQFVYFFRKGWFR